jgi:metal-responsive CopG/Arc/MetJ family transcriptional regulator
MRTIAISIDEPTLRALDRLAQEGGGRSRLVREAVREYVERRERADREARERAILHEHREVLAKELEALVEEQAEP